MADPPETPPGEKLPDKDAPSKHKGVKISKLIKAFESKPPEKDDTSTPEEDHEPTESELLEYMRPSSRHEFEKSTTSPKDKARILQGAKKNWRTVHKPPSSGANQKTESTEDAIAKRLAKIPGLLGGRQLASEAFRHATEETIRLKAEKSAREADRAATSQPDTRESTEVFSPSLDRGKIIGGVVAAFLALIAAIATAFQQAGVVNVLLAHAILGLGWLGFVLSVLFLEHVLCLPKRRKLKITFVAALVAGIFMLGADRLMVYLKEQQSTETKISPPTSPQALINPTPSLTGKPSPSPFSTPTPVRVLSSKPKQRKQQTTKRERPCTWEDTLLGRC